MKVLLIETDSKILLDEKLSSIIKGDNNVLIYNYLNTNLNEIIEEASYVSMFGELKWIIVKNADFFGNGKISEKETKMLSDYLNHPYELTNLIFTTYQKIDNRKAICKEFKKFNCIISLKTPKGYELTNNVKNLIKQKGYIVSDDAIKYIIDACINNWDLIYNEISKFDLIFLKNQKITLTEIKEVICSAIEDNDFKFIDNFIKKDAIKSWTAINDYIIKKTDPIKLINLLVREYRMLLISKIMAEQKYSLSDIGKELSVVDWQLDKIKRNASLYHKDDLKEILIKLAKLDYLIKSGKKDKWLAFEEFFVEQMEF